MADTFKQAFMMLLAALIAVNLEKLLAVSSRFPPSWEHVVNILVFAFLLIMASLLILFFDYCSKKIDEMKKPKKKIKKKKKKVWKKFEIFNPFMAVLWAAIIIASIFLAKHYISLIVYEQESFKLWANFFMMIAAFGTAFLLFYVGQGKKEKN